MTHVCVSNLATIGSDNGLSPGQRKAIIWAKDGIFFYWTLGTKFKEILIKIQNSLFTKMHLHISSAKWRPFYPEVDELKSQHMR